MAVTPRLQAFQRQDAKQALLVFAKMMKIRGKFPWSMNGFIVEVVYVPNPIRCREER